MSRGIKNLNLCLLLPLLFLEAISAARAASSAHYTPGSMDIRDLFLGAPGWYVAVYNYYYTSDQFNDANGNAVNSATIKPGPGPGLTINVRPSVDIYTLSPTLTWIAPWKLEGVKFGAYINPSFSNSSLGAQISTWRAVE
jgi:hypothetical protein